LALLEKLNRGAWRKMKKAEKTGSLLLSKLVNIHGGLANQQS
jgi:hypothetical protein